MVDEDGFDWCSLGVPAEPTDAVPGTPEKVAVMRRRHEAGERLHHPRDLRLHSRPGGGGDDDEAPFPGVLLCRVRRGRAARRSANGGGLS